MQPQKPISVGQTLVFKGILEIVFKFKWFHLSLAVTINSWKIPENFVNHENTKKWNEK
jgi:hypothetical protein